MDLAVLLDHPLARFIAQVIAIVVVSRVLGLVARRIGQPMVIAEITAGIVLGPSLLGWIAPGFSGVLFAPSSLTSLQLVSQIGLVLFMFLIGLELDPSLLRGRHGASFAVSHTGIVVPFALGALLAVYVYPRFSDPGVSRLAFTLFLGAAMSITAFPVLARILSERRLLRTRIGSVAIACAAVADLTAWCLLAFVVAFGRAKGLGAAVTTTLLSLGFVMVMLLVVRPLLARIGARVTSQEGLTQNIVAGVMLLLLASSWATEVIGIHALFGAFLFGAALPKDGALGHALAEKLEDVVLVLFLPLFFAFSGVRTQIGLLDDKVAWLVTGLIILVACAGKFGGSMVAARLTGLSWRESGALGVLMNTRGLMELIVLNIGLDLGVISPTVFTMMVVMALVTTFMTTPILNVIYPAEQFARELDVVSSPASSMPSPLPKFKVLMCVAQESSGPGLVSVAAAMKSGARVSLHALHLLEPTDRVSFHLEQGGVGPSDSLGSLMTRAEELDVRVTPESFVSTEPAEDICRVAAAQGAHLVLLGWHRSLLGQSLLGGTVRDVMKEAPMDVAVFVDRGLGEVRRILLPFVGTDHDRAAVRLARRFLREGTDVTLLHVRTPGPEKAEQQPSGPLSASPQLEALLDEPGGGRVELRMVHDDDPVSAAVAASRGGYDLVIVGVGRDWGLEQRLLGVQSERLVQGSPVSLLIVRGRPAHAIEAVARTSPGSIPTQHGPMRCACA